MKHSLNVGQGREITIQQQQNLNVDQVIRAMSSQHPSLVVMASHGLRGVVRSAVGSTIGRVAGHIAAPALVIR